MYKPRQPKPVRSVVTIISKIVLDIKVVTKYAITVLVEDGGYGNDSAAPVFREIIEKIQKNIKSN